MSGLSPEAQRILRAARGGDEPSPGDRKRIRSSLVVKIGAGIATASATTSAGSVAAAGAAKAAGTGLLAGILPKSILVLSAVGAIGIGAYAVEGPSKPPVVASAPATSSAARTPAVPPAAIPTNANEPAEESADEPADEETKEPAPWATLADPLAVPVQDKPSPHLAEEVESLREAHTALREGRATEAIEVLDRDAAPNDTTGLEPEREAMRIFALCRLGKTQEARTAADAFLSKWPKSPLAARVATSCTR